MEVASVKSFTSIHQTHANRATIMALASNVSQIQCATNVITLKDIKKRLLPQTAHASVEVITPLSTINAFYAAFLVV
jgi:hypothetical protein